MAKSTNATKRPATVAPTSGAKRSKTSSTIREALPETCTKADLSIILDVSIRALSDLDQRGFLVHGPVRGTYLLLPTIHAYSQRLRNAAAGRGESAETPLHAERLAREKIGRRREEIELAQIEGEILTLQEVSENWTVFGSKVKAAFLGLPTKFRQKLPHLSASDGEAMRKVVRNVLRDLAKEVEASVIAADPAALKSGGVKGDASGAL